MGRLQVSESGEPREVHHMCLMTGFGADAINPYMAYVALAKMKADNVSVPSGHTQDKLVANYIKSVSSASLFALFLSRCSSGSCSWFMCSCDSCGVH